MFDLQNKGDGFEGLRKIFEGAWKYQEIKRIKEMVEPFKHLDWEALSVPTTDMRLLQSFKDKVRNGVREFPVGYDQQILPLLEKLGISASFDPVYGGINADCGLFELSKLEVSDFCEPTAVELSIDRDNYLKLTNVHF